MVIQDKHKEKRPVRSLLFFMFSMQFLRLFADIGQDAAINVQDVSVDEV